MESHILNTYHQAQYRTIGLKRVSSTSDSNSSPSSCIVSSPEQKIVLKKFSYTKFCNGGLLNDQQKGYNENIPSKSNGQRVNITRTSIDSSDDEFIDVQDLSCDEKSNAIQEIENQTDVEESLVEGTDYDVIQVFAVDPDLDLEASDEETCDEEEDCMVNSSNNYESNNCESNDSCTTEEQISDSYILVKPKLQTVSNSDHSDGSHSQMTTDIEEVFVNDNNNMLASSVNSSKIEYKIPVIHPHIPEKVPNVDEFSIDPPAILNSNITEAGQSVNPELNIQGYSVLPNIEDIKRYLLEDIPYTKLKNVNRSLSVPQSPRHFSQIDYEDSKTCLSFEDLDLDLSDLSFENDKHKNLEVDDVPRTLTEEDVNSFFNTDNTSNVQDDIVNDDQLSQQVNTHNTSDVQDDIVNDDLSQQDMEIEKPIEAVISFVNLTVNSPLSSDACAGIKCIEDTKPTLLDYCKEKSEIKSSQPISKINSDEDFVDIESCNETVIPVLEANNVNSLLEQFEATEKINVKTTLDDTEPKTVDQEPKLTSVSNGVRLQEAGVQLNKNKMRHILMPTPNAILRRSSSPIHSDHDYCTVKRRPSLPPLRKGQSLLKPEVLSSNSKILSSRKKPKRIVYFTSSDEEGEKLNNKYNLSGVVSNVKSLRNKEICVEKLLNDTNSQPKEHISVPDAKCSIIDKGNESVILKDACKAGDTMHSQNSKPRIKLIIKNKAIVVSKCNGKDSAKQTKNNENSNGNILVNDKEQLIQKPYLLQTNETPINIHISPHENDKHDIKIEPVISEFLTPKETLLSDAVRLENAEEKIGNFYTELFADKEDVKIPVKIQIQSESDLQENIKSKIENNPVEEPPKKKKLNIQQYKLRRSGNSTNSSTSVSPEPIFPEVIIPTEKILTIPVHQTPPNTGIIKDESSISAPRKVYDPILEASRKILLQTKKQKAEAIRKRDEDIVMSKIPKVEKLQLQPLISDAEMLKIAGVVPKDYFSIPLVNEEKPKVPTAYKEIIRVSMGTSIDDKLLSQMEKEMRVVIKVKSPSPIPSLSDDKVQFTIKKQENISKHNIFENKKADNKTYNDKNQDIVKIEFQRFKAIEATLKTMGKQVDTKVSTNSLFSSIQDVVMKKAPDSQHTVLDKETVSQKRRNLIKVGIVRDFNPDADHGEDKVILHLEKSKECPSTAETAIQTDYTKEFKKLLVWENVVFQKPDVQKKDLPKKDTTRYDLGKYSEKIKEYSLKTANEEKSNMCKKRVATNSGPDERSSNMKQKRSQTEEKLRFSVEKSLTQKHCKEMTPPLKEMRSRSKEMLRCMGKESKHIRSHSRKRSHSKDKLSRREGRSRSKEKCSRSYGRRSRSKSYLNRRRRSRSRSRNRQKLNRSRSRCRRRSKSYDRYRGSRHSSSKRSRRSPLHRRRSPKTKKSESRSRTPTESYPVHNEAVAPPINEVIVLRKPVNEIKSMTPPLRKPTVSESSNVSTSSNSSSSSSSSATSATSDSSNTSSSSNMSSSSNSSRASRSTKSCSPLRRESHRRTRESSAPVEERRVVFVGKLEQDINKTKLRAKFVKFGPITEVRLHTKEDGTRYGFITFRCAHDAWTVVGSASRFPEYDIGFGGRRAFCRQTYADLDGLEAEYTEHSYVIPPPIHTNNDLSFEEMLAEMKNKLQKRKGDGKP